MLKKQNSNLVALATGLFFILADSHADIQKELDSKYTTKVKDKTVLMQEVRDLNDEEQMAAHITCDVEVYPSHLTLDQAAELKINIEEFVLANSELLTKDAGKPD